METREKKIASNTSSSMNEGRMEYETRTKRNKTKDEKEQEAGAAEGRGGYY